MDNIIRFITREVKAKEIFTIKLIDKKVAYEFIRVYHYLGDAKFFAKYSFGLYHKETDELLGVTTFTNPQGNVALKGWFGLENSDQTVMELSRLCVLPNLLFFDIIYINNSIIFNLIIYKTNKLKYIFVYMCWQTMTK